jgi:hypothetical protein
LSAGVQPDVTTPLRCIGYWLEPDREGGRPYPDPHTLVNPGWIKPSQRLILLGYLRSAPVPWVQMGYSPCRFHCGNVGSAEHWDGAWLWPEGLAHYVEVHDVALPAEFVERALSAPYKFKVPDLTDDLMERVHGSIDYDYWINWSREYSMQRQKHEAR